MKLELIRTYYPEGTNGKIFSAGRLMMYSIELPWKNNLAQVSCIPEGRYELVKRWSPKFNRHLLVMNVPQRNSILIHPANDAMINSKNDNAFCFRLVIFICIKNTCRQFKRPCPQLPNCRN